MLGSYVAFNLLPSDPFDLLASCIVSLTQRINKYVCMSRNVSGVFRVPLFPLYLCVAEVISHQTSQSSWFFLH